MKAAVMNGSWKKLQSYVNGIFIAAALRAAPQQTPIVGSFQGLLYFWLLLQ
jgi:hypothetical protein